MLSLSYLKPMNIEEYYQHIFEDTKTTIDQSLILKDQLAKVHSFADDILTWHEVLKHREESVILKNVASELQFAAFSLACGLYRQSFISLRIVLELSMATIFFSANELELREWQQGNYDIYWSKLVGSKKVDDEDQSDLDQDNRGVLSKRWTKAFFPDLEKYVNEYYKLARTTYRKLSEFVHGNSYTWGQDNVQISFSQETFNIWFENFSNVSQTISFILCLRFMKTLDKDDLNKLQATLIDFFAHLPEIRNVIELAVEE